jgi:UDP-2,3-diacylglucosamine pyrophosphatase LpxH
LNGLRIASAYKFPLLALVVGLGFLEWFLTRRKSDDALAPGLGGEGGIEQPVDTGSGTRTRERGGEDGPGTTTGSDDGDDPRDIPPPTAYGEEIEVDPNVPPVYVVSDFHIGSNKGIDKRKSNDMDSETLNIFLKWLDSVDLDAANYDHYDVVMNGDFMDLWQAKRPVDDTNANRLQDVLDSNNDMLSKLAQILRRRYPRCRFYYLIGNHDDAFFSSNDGSHYRARNSLMQHLRQDWHSQIIGGGDARRVWSSKPNNEPMSFKIDLAYSNSQYKLRIEHGHRFDSFNWKGDDDQAIGQEIAEYINQMQESDPAFENSEYTPNQQFVKHLICLKNNENTPEKVLDLIDGMESVAIWSNLENSVWGSMVDFFKYVTRGDRSVLDHPNVDPTKVKNDNKGYAEEIMDEFPNVKIVVLGHTHFRDLRPGSGESDWAYANSGTWLKEITASKDSENCLLKSKPSPLPYIKISKEAREGENEEGEDKALVELKYYRGNFAHQLVKVKL